MNHELVEEEFSSTEYMRELLEDIIWSLVTDSNSAQVLKVDSSETTIFTIDVKPHERGKIIGKGGIVINSIKNLFYAIGKRYNRNVMIEIKE